MNSQVVKCWSCGREFEVMLKRKPPMSVLKGLKPNDAVNDSPGDKGKAVVIARDCPFCRETNMIPIKEG